jgi:hypothetical protein
MMIRLKKVKTYGDWVTLVATAPKSALEVPGSQFRNEGVIVGIGHLVGYPFKVGDKVIVRNNAGLKIEAASGAYAGKELVILKASDIMIEATKQPDEEYDIYE